MVVKEESTYFYPLPFPHPLGWHSRPRGGTLAPGVALPPPGVALPPPRGDTDRTVAVAHADVTLEVEGRGAGEAEGLHEGVHLRLQHPLRPPGPLEVADERLVQGAPVGGSQGVVVTQGDWLLGGGGNRYPRGQRLPRGTVTT